MKGNTNIQVNGNVYGGIHVNGRGCAPCALPGDIAMPRSTSGWGVVGWILKALAILTGGSILLCGAIVAGGLALSLALVCAGGALSVVLGFYMLCRVGDLLLLIEHGLGGSHKRLVGASLIRSKDNDEWMAQLGPGNDVRELDALARENDYVDAE